MGIYYLSIDQKPKLDEVNMEKKSVEDIIEYCSPFFDRVTYMNTLYLNKRIRKLLSQHKIVLSIMSHPCDTPSYIPVFWELALTVFAKENRKMLNKDSYCLEFVDDELSEDVPHYHGNRLMKDEYIDGEIARDVSRTFPHHLLFRHEENIGPSILEAVLRKISDNYFTIGYCQGMNFVVGAILIALVDDELCGYYSDNDNDKLIEKIKNLDIPSIKSQTYDIAAVMIDRLELMELWGYGFPALPLHAFILKEYMNVHIPAIREHFEAIGFDLSILITKWFIPIFSNCLPFSLLYRIWDYIFVTGVSSFFRISIALLMLQYDKMATCDIIEISDLLHDLGPVYLKRNREVLTFFDTLSSLDDITDGSYMIYKAKYAEQCNVTMSGACKKQQDQLSSDIDVLLSRIKAIYHTEIQQRFYLKNNKIDEKRYEMILASKRNEKAIMMLRYDEGNEVVIRERMRRKEEDHEEIGESVKTLSQMNEMEQEEVSPINARDVGEAEREGYPEEIILRTISRELTQLNNDINELEKTIHQLRINIQESINSLEDINTQRLSLRIQLSQLYKERALLLFKVHV